MNNCGCINGRRQHVHVFPATATCGKQNDLQTKYEIPPWGNIITAQLPTGIYTI
ncbi:hypothetical protein DAPPUDRAFT_235979 [Daphnia pulex]|uniref:Uncharacterized protein n=1 Tax=Daphnia pulex TaxID=6669 RepID=E9FZL5_DAPPU|nr:hypothetical protein DAPPUDRAFT_235979 [Daphnia pulex]|eukprot:EFX87078.1 hypothetical protein DAPPUDRAFT_235979 [Daphnia pulex]